MFIFSFLASVAASVIANFLCDVFKLIYGKWHDRQK